MSGEEEDALAASSGVPRNARDGKEGDRHRNRQTDKYRDMGTESA